MPTVPIYMPPADIAAAHRIAKKMFPADVNPLDAQHVIAAAARMGMDSLRVIWHDAEDQQNAYANAMVKRDKQERNAGGPEHDRTSDGMPLKTGQ